MTAADLRAYAADHGITQAECERAEHRTGGDPGNRFLRSVVLTFLVDCWCDNVDWRKVVE